MSLPLSLTPRDSSSLSLLLSRFLHLLRITLVSSSVCPGKTRMGGLQITERQGPPVSPNYPDLSVFPSLLSKTCRTLLQGLEWMADTHSSLDADVNLIRKIKLSVHVSECVCARERQREEGTPISNLEMLSLNLYKFRKKKKKNTTKI